MLEDAGIRTQLDDRNEKIGYKIREARMERVPYMLVVGPKEAEQGLVSVRSRFAGDEGAQSVESFIRAIREEIDNRAIRETTVEDAAQ